MAVFVIPAYNEERNVPRLLADLESRPELWRDGRILLVDDGSTDGTVRTARAHRGALPLEIVEQGRNRGPGRAFDRGFRRALERCDDGAPIVTLESDATSDLDALTSMLAAARAGADLVLASHHQGELLNVAAHRRILSRAAAYAIRHSARVDTRTVSSFFRVYRAGILRAGYERYGDAFIREAGFACKAEILIKLASLDAQVAEIPVALDWSRREGESQLRVLPTAGAYARLMMRQVAARVSV